MAVYESGLQDRFEHGEVSGEQFADDIRQRLGLTDVEMPTMELLDAISDMFTPIDSMRGVLRKVREHGYRVGLLSNTCHAHWDWIARQKYEVIDFPFDVTILSFEVGSMKPDEAIYRAAEDAAGLRVIRFCSWMTSRKMLTRPCSRGWHAVQCFGGQQAIAALKGFRVMGESP